ncbi:MAG: hypothetical protein H5U03_01420 [Clostridia bacterium]|nr:hypothetical protein [Clostridia bacterium]
MFTRLLERVALVLDDADVPYMVIGGQAVLLYGEPRLTEEVSVLSSTLQQASPVPSLSVSAC